MKITKRQLKKIISEMINNYSISEPLEKEFIDGPDKLAGYIVVRDNHEHNLIASAPIMRTDGPDRPFLVRTTDTVWHVPHGIVRAIYSEIGDVFNWVDSKEDWNDLGPGDRGEVGLFEWEWVPSEITNLNADF